MRLLLIFLLATGASFSQARSRTAASASFDLNLLLQSLERVEQRNPALARGYEVTREYKMFRADDTRPISEITAQISFTPPDTKTFKIMQATGNSRGEKIVREILEQETESARDGRNDISRTNYEFAFLRQENFGFGPEYVLRILPKRKENNLIVGQIWIDARSFRVRRIEGVLLKTPSWWIKDIHITLQFAEVNEMWICVSLDAIATVRLLGRYTLAGLCVAAQNPKSVALAH